MIALGWVVNLLERGRASMARLNYILDIRPAVRDGSDLIEQEIQGEVEFRNLSFSYNGTPVIRVRPRLRRPAPVGILVSVSLVPLLEEDRDDVHGARIIRVGRG